MTILAIDIETGGLDWGSEVLAISYAVQDGVSGCFNVWYSDLFTIPDKPTYIASELCKLIDAADIVTFHNASFDVPYLVRDGYIGFDQLAGKLFDTQLIARMTGRHDDGVSLKALCNQYGIVVDWGDMKSKRSRLKESNWESVKKYAIEDARATLQLAQRLLVLAFEIYKDEEIWEFGDYVLEISKMRVRGIPLDLDHIRDLIKDNTSKKEEITYSLNNARIKNGNDNKGIASYLQKMGVTLETSEAGNPILDEGALHSIKESNPIVSNVVDLVLSYRHIDKQLSTFLQGFLDHNFGDGKVHPLYGAAGTYTYRLNCSQPNAQAVDRTIKLFTSPPGYKLVEADYKAMELRLAAMYAAEHKFAEIFSRGEDFHWSTAYLLFGDGATKSQRQQAKTCNFSIIYGGGSSAVAESLGIDLDFAKELVSKYRKTFFAISKASKQAEQIWKDRGYLVLAHGIRLYAREEELERSYKAFNNLVQASVSQIVRTAIMDISKNMPDCYLIAQTHDDLKLLVPEDVAEERALEMVDRMSNACPKWLEERTNPKIRLEVEYTIK